MVDHTIRTVIRFKPHEGEEETFRSLIQDAVHLAEDGPGTIDHIWWRGPDDGHVTLTEQYIDSNSLLALLEGDLGRRVLPQMMRSASLESFEMYGPVSKDLFMATKHLAPRIGSGLAAYRRSRLELAIDRHAQEQEIGS